MAWTNPSTAVSGEVLTAAVWNSDVRDNVKFLARPPSVRVERDATQSLDNSTWTEISFDVEAWDTDTMWSSTAATKVFAKTAGKYLVTGIGSFAASTAGSNRAFGFRKNTTSGGPSEGSMLINPPETGAGANYRICVTNLITLTTGQYLQFVGFQDSGSGLNTIANETIFSMLWVSS